jgi:hypothetical protein
MSIRVVHSPIEEIFMRKRPDWYVLCFVLIFVASAFACGVVILEINPFKRSDTTVKHRDEPAAKSMPIQVKIFAHMEPEICEAKINEFLNDPTIWYVESKQSIRGSTCVLTIFYYKK